MRDQGAAVAAAAVKELMHGRSAQEGGFVVMP